MKKCSVHVFLNEIRRSAIYGGCSKMEAVKSGRFEAQLTGQEREILCLRCHSLQDVLTEEELIEGFIQKLMIGPRKQQLALWKWTKDERNPANALEGILHWAQFNRHPGQEGQIG